MYQVKSTMLAQIAAKLLSDELCYFVSKSTFIQLASV